MNDSENKTMKRPKKFFISFLLGGAIGGVIALLFAPKSGKNLRNDISRKTNELISEGKLKGEHLWNNTKEQLGSTLDNANDFLNTSKEKIKNKTEKVKDAFKAGVSEYNKNIKSGNEENVSSAEEDENTLNKIT